MFSHIMLGASDIEASKKFYDAALGALGYGPGVMDPKGRVFYITDTGIFALSTPIDGNPATAANGGTIGFASPSVEASEAWHAAGLANGVDPIAARVIVDESDQLALRTLAECLPSQLKALFGS